MRHEISSKPDYAALHVHLDAGEKLVTESGAMMSMSGGLSIETSTRGGVFKGIKRALGGESFFMNTYTADSDGQQIDVAPSSPGDIEHAQLSGNAIIVQSGSFLCSSPEVDIDLKWGGAKAFFAGERILMLRASGHGDLWMSSYGAIHTVDVSGSYIVDTGHIVAFEDGLDYNVRSVGGFKSLFLSSEGLVCNFSGQGRLWLQTRNPQTLASFLHPFRSIEQQSDGND